MSAPDLSSPVTRHDYAHYVWIGCRQALETAAAASTSPEPLHVRAQIHDSTVRRVIRGQDRLTIDTFTLLAVTLGLDPVTILRTAVEDATAAIREAQEDPAT